jgi:hypothetical protein
MFNNKSNFFCLFRQQFIANVQGNQERVTKIILNNELLLMQELWKTSRPGVTQCTVWTATGLRSRPFLTLSSLKKAGESINNLSQTNQ